MRKMIAAGAITAASIGSFTTKAENPAAVFEGAPHGVTERCAEQLLAQYDYEFLASRTAVDIARAEYANSPTADDARERAEKLDIRRYPRLRNYIEQHSHLVQRFRLPDSLIQVELLSDINGWNLDPDSLETVLKRSLQSRTGSESLQALSYQCMLDEIYAKRRLAGQLVTIAVLGTGDRCIAGAGDRLVPRGLDLCTNNAWYFGSDGLMVITPPDEVTGSTSVAHEFNHRFTTWLNIRPEDKGGYEFSAYTFEDIAAEIMQEQNLIPLTLNMECERLAPPLSLC